MYHLPARRGARTALVFTELQYTERCAAPDGRDGKWEGRPCRGASVLRHRAGVQRRDLRSSRGMWCGEERLRSDVLCRSCLGTRGGENSKTASGLLEDFELGASSYAVSSSLLSLRRTHRRLCRRGDLAAAMWWASRKHKGGQTWGLQKSTMTWRQPFPLA